jgi:hypothetical protein
MTDHIHPEFYGANCPITALYDASGSDKFQLPPCNSENAMNALKSIVGDEPYDNSLITEDIKNWFVQIDAYFDITILGVIGKSDIDFESIDFWKDLLTCVGVQRFVSKLTIKIENDKIFNECARTNNISICKWLIKNKSIYNLECALFSACSNGHMECANFCVENGAKYFNRALYSACLNGHLECAKWCVENGANDFNGTFYYACETGHLECAKWCVENGAKYFNYVLNIACMKNGQLECAKLCVENGANDFNGALNYACSKGQMECAKWCVANGADEFDDALNNACTNGHLECAKWCVENGANDFNNALTSAFTNGHLECAKFCAENGANNFNSALYSAFTRIN